MNPFRFGFRSTPQAKNYWFMTKKHFEKIFCSRIWGTLRAFRLFELQRPLLPLICGLQNYKEKRTP